MDEEIKKTLVGKVYDDVLSPVAKQIGVTLGEAAKFILTPIYQPTKLVNTRIENWFNRLNKDVPEKQMVEAAPNISIPTLQGLALNPDETLLGEMFYNILKSSIDSERQQFISPAFPKLLEQLTRDEATILLLLDEQSFLYEKQMDLSKDKSVFENERDIRNDFPMNKLFYPDNFWIYIDHLNNLNLANCVKYKSEEPIYSENIVERGTGAFSCPTNEQIGLKIFAEFKLTTFGKQFAKVCITDRCKNFIE